MRQESKALEILICMIEAIPRYRGLQGSTVTVLIRCPMVFILLTESFVDVDRDFIILEGASARA
jgi:hypothetical protein